MDAFTTAEVNGILVEEYRDDPTDWTAERAKIQVRLPVSGRFAHVDVDGPGIAFRRPRPATVNWSAIGSVEPADADAYAAALIHAAAVAPTLRGPLKEI